MSFLLDTHVFLWLLASPDRIPPRVRTQLADPAVPLLVSAVSAFEVATKSRLGKLQAPGLLETWSRRVADLGADELALTTEHSLLAGTLPWEHRDPFDRLLVGQAMTEGAVLVTVDSAIAQLPAPAVMTW